MNYKSLSILLLTALYFVSSHYWYCCHIRAACYGCATKVQAAPPIIMASPEATSVLTFEWSAAKPKVLSSFEDEKAKWLAGKSADNLLIITGRYYGGEEYQGNYGDLGLARADAVRKLLLLDLPDERMRLQSKKIVKRNIKTKAPFESVDLEWRAAPEEITAVLDFGNKAIIHFPEGSYNKESNKKIDAFLAALAERVKATGETVFITGHTDAVGKAKNNLRLGKKRALRIRRILRQKKVPRDQLVVNSKGEAEPVASNETASGRAQNRRVVIEIK
ncbi:MAG TPA: OmpA family protein [Phaeodactylibacter sp.]|nr:OmpA family protein [Phaeodactylibacter sp.]